MLLSGGDAAAGGKGFELLVGVVVSFQSAMVLVSDDLEN
jgi:hypothetical protein